ncbi:hypothetical protein RFN25_09745 [Mesorhizobium abyssinicae]|uniref:Uncharacterized protein n=1 Tax=Mesorhizobium abyssinicae TaxID=1209958 RepID=A0ABU5AUN9_9HYPH|nr:hypothetical protein [Mesorhizobium abyssinicae]MDX8433718.1 hypothetical protein [Mesorhizobium abyssinicae]MDX8540904.1 hypothetical protein [Mesorhizobium abyssinicae]
MMTKNLHNATRNTPIQEIRPSLLGKVAPALFPLVVVALGYFVGRQFFGF